MAGSHIDITRMKEAESNLRKHAAELLAAKVIQERLLPQMPPCLPGFDVAGVVHPAEYAAGDYFDFIPLPNDSVAFVVGDVTGHGFSRGAKPQPQTTSPFERASVVRLKPLL